MAKKISNEERAQRLIVSEVSKVLDLLNTELDTFCKNNNTEIVPKFIMQNYINIVKKSYTEGALSKYDKK